MYNLYFLLSLFFLFDNAFSTMNIYCFCNHGQKKNSTKCKLVLCQIGPDFMNSGRTQVEGEDSCHSLERRKEAEAGHMK